MISGLFLCSVTWVLNLLALLSSACFLPAGDSDDSEQTLESELFVYFSMAAPDYLLCG